MFVLSLVKTMRNERTVYYLKRGGTAVWTKELKDAEFFPSYPAAIQSPHVRFTEPNVGIADLGLMSDELINGGGAVDIVVSEIGVVQDFLSVGAQVRRTF